MRNRINVKMGHKIMTLTASLVFLCSMVFGTMKENLKCVAGKAYVGTAIYHSGNGDVTRAFKLMFNKPASKGEFSGEGTWSESQGGQVVGGPLEYEVSNDFLTVKLSIISREHTGPLATLRIMFNPQNTGGVPSLPEGHLIAYTGARFRDLRSRGFLSHYPTVVPVGSIGAISGGHFQDLLEINLHKE